MSDLLKCYVTNSGSIGTPRGRMMFCALDKKFVSKEDKIKGRDGAYTVTLIVPPTVDLTVLKEAIKAKASEKFGGKVPGNMKWPIKPCKEVFTKKGDPKYGAEYADWLQISANTFQQQPGVVDEKANPVSKLLPGESTDDVKARLQEQAYNGRFARITVDPHAYSNESNGVKLYLQNVQLLDHADRIGGRNTDPEDDFVPVGGAADAGVAATAAPTNASNLFD